MTVLILFSFLPTRVSSWKVPKPTQTKNALRMSVSPSVRLTHRATVKTRRREVRRWREAGSVGAVRSGTGGFCSSSCQELFCYPRRAKWQPAEPFHHLLIDRHIGAQREVGKKKKINKTAVRCFLYQVPLFLFPE